MSWSFPRLSLWSSTSSPYFLSWEEFGFTSAASFAHKRNISVLIQLISGILTHAYTYTFTPPWDISTSKIKYGKTTNQQFRIHRLRSQRVDIKCMKYTKCDPKMESNNHEHLWQHWIILWSINLVISLLLLSVLHNKSVSGILKRVNSELIDLSLILIAWKCFIITHVFPVNYVVITVSQWLVPLARRVFPW